MRSMPAIDMRMKDPKPQFSYIVSKLKEKHSDLAYIHVIEPSAEGNHDRDPQDGEDSHFLRQIWQPNTYISAGGYDRKTGIKAAEKNDDIVAYGRWFISNVSMFLCTRHLTLSLICLVDVARPCQAIQRRYPLERIQHGDFLPTWQCRKRIYRLPLRRSKGKDLEPRTRFIHRFITMETACLYNPAIYALRSSFKRQSP